MRNMLRAGAVALVLMTCAPVMANDPNLGMTVAAPAGFVPSTAIYCADANAKTIVCPFGSSTGGAVPDVFASGTIAAGTPNATYSANVGNGQNVVTFTVSGLTVSGATLVSEGSNDNGSTWTNAFSANGSTGVLSNTFTADGSFSINVAGRTRIRLRVSAAGSGTIAATSNLSVAVREVRLDAPLPPGTNSIGKVAQDATINWTFALVNGSFGTVSGNPLFASITNTFLGARLQDASGAAFGTAGNPIITAASCAVIGTPGTAAPACANQVGGVGPSGNLRTLGTGTNGGLISTQAAPTSTRTALTANAITTIDAARATRIFATVQLDGSPTAAIYLCFNGQSSTCSATVYDVKVASGAADATIYSAPFGSTGAIYAFLPTGGAAIVNVSSWIAQ